MLRRISFGNFQLRRLAIPLHKWKNILFKVRSYSTIKPQQGSTEWVQDIKGQISVDSIFTAKNGSLADSAFYRVAQAVNECDGKTFLAEIGKINKNDRDPNQNTLLHWAAGSKKGGGMAKVLLEMGLDANAKNSPGSTPLMVAAANNDVGCMKVLLDYGADLHAQDNNNNSALHYACVYDALDAVQLLLEKGIDVNHLGGKDYMYSAIEFPFFSPEICKLLLEAGAKVDRYMTLPGNLPHMVVQAAQPEVVKMILEAIPKCKKSDGTQYTLEEVLEKTDDRGQTLLSSAAEVGKEETVKVLLAMGAKVNAVQIKPEQQNTAQLYTPLRRAIVEQHPKCVKILLNAGAEVGIMDLITAVERGNSELVQLLVEEGKIDANCTFRGLSPLTIAAMLGHLEVVKKLAQLGAKLDAVFTHGETQSNAYSFAVLKGHDDIVRYFWKEKNLDPGLLIPAVETFIKTNNLAGIEKLHEMGMDISKIVNAKITPMHIAAATNNVQAIGMLARFGAETDSQASENRNATPLIMAASRGALEAVKLLIKLKADVNLKCDGGQTAFGYSANTEILQALYDAGSDVNNKGGVPPLSFYARSCRPLEHIQKLLDLGADINVDGPTGTPIMLAAVAGNLPLVRLLMARGASPSGNFTFNFGTKTMGITEMAIRAAGEGRGSLELVEECYKYETEKSGKLGLGPLLIYTAHYGFAPFVDKLLQIGAPVDTITPPNDTSALHMATSNNKVEVVKLLLLAGANRDLKTKNGTTALDIAKSKNFHEIAELIAKK